MTGDIVLSGALRTNLASLSNTQTLIDQTQARLSTGKKVSSALDNPQSFFQASSLTNSANDYSNLLDGIGQSIQAIQAANTGVTSLTSLINQANSLATQAQSAQSGASATAVATGNAALTGTSLATSLTGVTASSVLTFNVTDPTGGTNKINGSSTANTVTISSTDTVNDIVTKINDLNTTDNLSTPAIKASLDSSGHLQISAANGGTLNVGFATSTNTDVTNEALASGLGFGSIATLNVNGAAASGGLSGTVGFTSSQSTNLNSSALYAASGTLAQATTKLASLTDSSGNAITNLHAGTTLKLTIGGKTSADLLVAAAPGAATPTAATQTVQGLVDGINNDTNIGSLVTASFDASTGKISIEAKDPSADAVQFSLVSGGATAEKLNVGFGTSTLTTTNVSGDGATENIRFGAAAGNLASLQTQYNTTLDQIDSLTKDSGYQGTNLLNGDNLTTYFSADHSSNLVTSGVNFTAGGLGLKAADFQNSNAINTAVTQTDNALSTVRSFGSSLAGDLSIIQTRQDFTKGIISTLQTGSDNLTNADTNQESANLLALQTRQSLGVDALSLASQSQQSVLKLFG